MKRVNLLDYMKLSDTMADATRALALDNTKHGYLYFTFDNLMRTVCAVHDPLIYQLQQLDSL
ncbi:hypothetical protein, partial [Brucella intermedia]|uniref:hypothetical protein n=1 Tax=Brucella intermedia TaxID=94625 RepID=UPI00235F7EBA